MYADFLTLISYPFIFRALVVGVIISFCSALIGTNLVLKRYAMMADGLSHLSFASLAVAQIFWYAPLSIALPVTILASILLLRIKNNKLIKGDAALALLSSASLAFGILVIAASRGMTVDICNYMFGSILLVRAEDIWISLILGVFIIGTYLIFYPQLFAVSFDSDFAQASGLSVNFYNDLLAVLTGITVVLGMKMIGTLLISSLLVFPALSALKLCKSHYRAVWISVLLSLPCFFVGLYFSYHFSTPTGASIVMVNFLTFLGASLVSWLRNRKRV